MGCLDLEGAGNGVGRVLGAVHTAIGHRYMLSDWAGPVTTKMWEEAEEHEPPAITGKDDKSSKQ